MSLPIDKMKSDAARMLALVGEGSPFVVGREDVGDLACHVLALADLVGHLMAICSARGRLVEQACDLAAGILPPTIATSTAIDADKVNRPSPGRAMCSPFPFHLAIDPSLPPGVVQVRLADGSLAHEFRVG